MTPEMNRDNNQIDHVKPISSFNASKDEKLTEAFNWVGKQPLKKTIFKKGDDFDYRLQFINAYHFLIVNGQEEH